MLCHELTRGLVRALRLGAALLAVIALGMAALRWHQTTQFLESAHRTTGTVVSSTEGGIVVIAFSLAPNQEHRFTARDAGVQNPGTAVPVAFLVSPGQPVEARIAVPQALWSPSWTWAEIALAALLAAVYGRALVEDPASVIGFKSWRLFRRPRRD